MKTESRLTVQLEGPRAYAGRRERQAPAPKVATARGADSEAKHRGAVEGPVRKESPSTVRGAENFHSVAVD